MRRANTPLSALIGCLILTGCASASKTYPSIAIRDAERVNGTFAPPVSKEPAPLRQEFARQLDQIRVDAAASHENFLAAAPGARSAVSAGADAELSSNAWATAQIAISDLESLRSITAVALGDLDLMFADATLAFEKRQAVAAARDEVLGYLRVEDSTLAELRSRLPQ